MTIHPASLLDYEEIGDTLAKSLTGQTTHWDSDMARMHPKMTECSREEAEEILSNCVERGLVREYLEPDHPRAPKLITQWCGLRIHEVNRRMMQIRIEDGHVTAHRIIATKPKDLKSPLGIFWSHDFDNWPDPVTPWGNNLRGVPTLVVEGRVPVEAINWRFSALALMSWLLGDTESELRLYPGHPIRDVKVTYLEDGKSVEVPDQNWIS